MTDPIEVELKLDFDPGDRAALDGVAALSGTAAHTDHLVSLYFDTPDALLRQAGYTLRIRRDGDRRIQTVKAEDARAAGLFVRPEWEREVEGDLPRIDEASGPLATLLDEQAAGLLAVRFITDVKRSVRRIRIGETEIECAIDAGELWSDGRTAPLCEIELELLGGDPVVLFDLARRIDGQVPLRLGVRSKAERGYLLSEADAPHAHKAEKIALDPAGDVGDAFLAIAQSCLRQFRLNEPLVLSGGGADALHQARVGIRRLRSAFSLFKPLFAGDSAVEPLRQRLRTLAATLGEVRNLDVLLPRVEGEAHDALAVARATALADAQAALHAREGRGLMIDLAAWLAIGAWRTTPADPDLLHGDVTAFAGDLLERRRKRLKRRGRDLAALSDDARHEVRIEAKKLRYASEFFASLYAGHKKQRRRHRDFVKAMEALQDHLGELNDLATAPEVLERLNIDLPQPKHRKRDRARLLNQAEEAFEALIDAKRFWRD